MRSFCRVRPSALQGLSRSFVPVVLFAVLTGSRPALAQAGTADGHEPQRETKVAAQAQAQAQAQAEAQGHFLRAKDLYQAGAYREAIGELEQARSLDPNAKDLVFNLGVVHEKLGNFDDALVFFHHYLRIGSITPQERAKVETNIKRIEGAKRAMPPAPVMSSGPEGGLSNSAAVPEIPTTSPRQPATSQSDGGASGRIDAATVTAGAVALVGLGTGAVFGILAATHKPGANEFTTGRDGTYDSFATRVRDAHELAVVADVGFGVGIAAAVVATYLFLSRPRVLETPRRSDSKLPAGTRASCVPARGMMLLKGTF